MDTWAAVIKDWATGAVVSESDLDQEIRDRWTVFLAAMDGDTSGTTVKHRHKTGTWANRPSAGEAGRLYYCTDTGWTLMDDGSLWTVIAHNPRLSDHLYNDFHEPGGDIESQPPLTSNGWMFGWRFTVAAGAAGADHGGGRKHSYAALIGKTADGGCAHFTPYGNAEKYIDSASGACYPLILEMGVRLVDNALVTYHLGLSTLLGTTTTPAPASSIMFRYGSAGDADALQYFTVTQHNSGGEQKNDSGTTPGHSTLDILRIEVDDTSEARFYINGLLKATHDAGIPNTDSLHPGFSVRTNTSSNKEMRVDYVDLRYKRSVT